MPNWIGDLVMATPILADLKKKFPLAHITALSSIPGSDLLQNNPYVDTICSFHKPSNLKRRTLNREIIEKLKKEKYDIGILLTHSFSSAWWFFKGGVKKRIGYRGNFRSFLLTHPLSFPLGKETHHLVTTYKYLLSALDIAPSTTSPAIFTTDQEIQETRSFLQNLGIGREDIVVGINPGAAYGSAKCWLPERFQEVTEALITQKNIKILYFGNQSTSSLVESICTSFPKDRVLNLSGKTTIRQLACLIHVCHLLLTNDSGPMHMAAALNTPLIALFGSTNDTVTGPFLYQGKVIHKHVFCSPCYQRKCPLDFRCMKQISSAEVLEEIKAILSKTRCYEPI